MENLSELLTSWRVSAGLSPAELADLVPFSERSIREWEKGASCSARSVGAIGRACGVKPHERLRAVLDAAGEGEAAGQVWALLGVGGGGS